MLTNYHLIKVEYKGATNYKPSQVKISSLRFPGDTITVPVSYQYNNIADQGAELLKTMGFKIKGKGYDETKKFFILISETFEPIKENFKKRK